MKKVLLIVFGIMSFAVADVHPGLKKAIDRGDIKTAENLVKKFNIKDVYCPSNISFEQAFPIYEDIFSSNPSVMWEKCDPAFVKSAERNVCKQSVSLCKYHLGKLFQEGDADLLNSVFEDILQAKLHIQKERRLVEQHEFVKASKQECIDQLENIRTQKNDSIINWYNADCRYLFDAASCSKIFGKFGVASIDSVNTSYSIKVKECKKKPTKIIVKQVEQEVNVNPFLHEIELYDILLSEKMKNPFYINPNVLNVYKELKKNDKPDEKVKKQTEIYWNALNKNLAAFCLAYPGNGSRENNCKETVKNYTNDFNLSYDENRIIKELSNVYAASGVISDSLIAFSCKLFPHIDKSFYEIMEVNVFDCNAVNQYLIENKKCANSDSTYIQEFSSGIKYICEGKKWRNLKFNEIKNGICSSEGELKNGLYCVKKLGWIKTPAYKNFIDDRDGQAYRAVKIGNQIWMAENLNYRVMDSYCYENEKDNCDKYGRLYTWYSMMSMNNNGCLEEKNNCSEKTQIQGICPDGWHLPSKNEFENLIENAKKNGSLINALRSADGWLDGKNGANILGFNAYPVNSWNPAGFFGKNGFGTDFWSSSRITGTYSVEPRAYNFVVGDSDSHSGLSYNFMRETSYVRCVKDSKPKPDKVVKRVETNSSYVKLRVKQSKEAKK